MLTFFLLALLGLSPKTNWTAQLAWSPSTNAVGYWVYGTNITYSNRWNAGNETNFVVNVPLPMRRTRFWVTAYDTNKNESLPGNVIYFPGDRVVDVRGTQLETFTNLLNARKTFMGASVSYTNPTEPCRFFDDLSGDRPKINLRMFYGY